MARRYLQKDDDFEGEHSTSGYVSLAGIIKLQPNRKKANGTWRPMRASDLGECENAAYDAINAASTVDRLPSPGVFVESSSVSPHTQTAIPMKVSSTSENPTALTNRTNIYGVPTALSGATNNEVSSRGTHIFATDHYEQLFGKLPDPIRLHEQMGDFDGQVVFIAHPNRDVSAHQWSSASFQWVNIGRYAHLRGKVEGSLASDRLKGYGASHSPTEFFKLAAKNRENLIVENGRPKAEPVGVHRIAPAVVTRKKSLSTASSLLGDSSSVFAHGSGPSGFPLEGAKPTTPGSLHATVRREYLEDPFVAPMKTSISKVPSGIQPRSDKIDPKGSLDFEYEFPFRSVTSAVPETEYVAAASQKPNIEKERGGHEACYGTTNTDRASQPSLREVAFGEEAASGLAILAERDFLSQNPLVPPSPVDIHNRWALRHKLAEIGDQAVRAGAPTQGRIAMPNFAYLQPTARSLFPPPGLTVANPHRTVSNLNASAPPYTNTQAAAEVAETSGSETTTVNATAAALKFSDPDGLRQTQEYEIANGLGQQAPTPQSFKGPFFTDSKPTTSDPTVLLSVHISEKEKLVNWFRDGHRPARQQEYAKTLMSAAAPSSKSRSFGIIGEAFDAQKRNLYDNTPPFVRLYEGLSEYIEEYRNGSGRSYFTRTWKAAPPQLRDLGLDGNNSYFSRPTANPDGIQAMLGSVDHQPGHGWFEIGSSFILSRARLSHGSLLDDGNDDKS